MRRDRTCGQKISDFVPQEYVLRKIGWKDFFGSDSHCSGGLMEFGFDHELCLPVSNVFLFCLIF